MIVVAWNMRRSRGGWDLLHGGGALDADVHILCEAPKPPRRLLAVGQWRTVGLADALPLDKPVVREWSTAVLARSSPTFITDARTAREYKTPLQLPFKPSRPGSWTAASVKVGRATITVVALYGLLDEKSDASVHRSLSELSPLFDHPKYGKNLLLGGDLNIFANPRSADPARERHLAVLDRIEAYGLRRCLGKFKRPLREAINDPCPCGLRRCRRHWRTYRRHPQNPGPAYEEDFLFASDPLFARLEECRVLPFADLSDHAPVMARFS
jgi:hypothetical protein